MVAMTEKKCNCCGVPMQVRTADVKRGWGKYCSKRCKAIVQERKNGQHRAFLDGRGVSNLHPERLKNYVTDDHLDDVHPFSSEGLGQWT